MHLPRPAQIGKPCESIPIYTIFPASARAFHFLLDLPPDAGLGRAEDAECYNGSLLQYFEVCASRFPSSLAQAVDFVGEWLSLVEHLVRDQGVGGSNPLSPTNILKQIIGLGCGPLWSTL